MMILSVSRRTDLPNYYFDWFLNRIREGYFCVRNPFNCHQVSRVSLSPSLVDCLVFWTKNPVPMLSRLTELDPYLYYFQFTLTSYGKEVEPGLPDKRRVLLPAFLDLSGRIGKERVIWRYDPIFFSDTYTMEYHKKAFEEIAETLCGHTDRVVVSFLDFYEKTRRNMKGLHVRESSRQERLELSGFMAATAGRCGMEIVSCAEEEDLSCVGIGHGCCIDKELIERLFGRPMKAGRDRNQRKACGCIESIDAGCYHTCLNGCRYCYANDSADAVIRRSAGYDAMSPMLCGCLRADDRVTDRAMKSLFTDVDMSAACGQSCALHDV